MPEVISNSRILIVDDQPVNIKLLRKMLNDTGLTDIMYTVDPREGLGLLRQNSIDLVLLDLNMPHIDGFEFLEKMDRPQNAPYPPVLVLTAMTDEKSKLRALQAGAQDFLSKPFCLPEVVFRINNLLKMNQMHQELSQTNARLEKSVQERTQELFIANQNLIQTRAELIKRLGRTAEYYDQYGSAHEMRMSLSAEKLATATGISPEECENIRLASSLHDFGKVGIPESIINKPGKLNAEEWKEMQRHPEIGAKILGESKQPLLNLAKDIAWSHHERWDGTGYPRKLEGEQIPLAARITSLCDTFDSLISPRQYREAWSVPQAFDYIKQESGKHFDPDLVNHFMDIKTDILEIVSLFKDPQQETGSASLLVVN